MANHLYQTIRRSQSRLDGIVESAAVLAPHHKPIDNQANVMHLTPIEAGWARQIEHLSIHPHPDKALLHGSLEQLPELAFATSHEGGHHLDLGALGPVEHRLGDLRGALATNRLTVIGTVRGPSPSPKQP